MPTTRDLNIVRTTRLVPPSALLSELKMSESDEAFITRSRLETKQILAGADTRLLVAVGPCSIHDCEAAKDYAGRLKRLSDKVGDRLFVLMRVYFEKPRTTLGWKGLINDPYLNDTFDVEAGLKIARRLLIDIAGMQLPVATEMLDPITPQYIADLITLASIGARTTESQTHRQMASGLSMPVGYKNGTDGSLDGALNAMRAAGSPHRFLGIDTDGHTCVLETKGNPHGFLILRGGRTGPNYDSANLEEARRTLQSAHLPEKIVVDCSHANSEKDHRKQRAVWQNVIRQRAEGNASIMGLMLESNLKPGTQKLEGNPASLEYGVSITDACLGWEETEELILEAYDRLSHP